MFTEILPTSIYWEDESKVALRGNAQVFNASGAIVDVEATGKGAIALYKENNYNLVLMDLSLPDGYGISITKALLAMEHKQGVKIVALTAHVLMEDREKCLAAGMQDVLTKPLARSEIIRVLSKIGETK